VGKIYKFGRFVLNEKERLLEREGSPVPLSPKAFDTLLLLVANAGRLVEKNALLSSVWAGVHVEESVITRTISDLRKALKQTEEEVWIETVPKFGYRFSAAVRQEEAEAPAGPMVNRSLLGRGVVGLAAGIILLLLVQGVKSSYVRETGHVQRLAVLPFVVLGEASEAAALSLGLADALITRLSNLRELIVRPITAVRPYTNVDAVKAGRDLRVDVVLEGTFQEVDGRVRANVRLVRPGDGQALWAGTVESPKDRIFTLADSLAQQIASNLAVRLSERERRTLDTRAGLDPGADELYFKGRYEWGKRNKAGFERAAEYFLQAIEEDGAYARAYAGLADSYLLLGGYSFQPQLETLPKAKALASRALELDPTLAEAHTTLALVSQNLDWDWGKVENHYRKAIALAPNYATARHWYAEFLSILGRFEESEGEFARAREIDPISPIIQVDEAQLYFFEKQFDRNLETLRQVLQLDPSFEMAHERMAYTYLVQGREEDAWREVELMGSCREEASDCRRIWTAWLPRRDARAAREALLWLEAEAKKRRVPPSALVVAHARQGNHDRAMEWMESMLDKHEVWLITAKVNPMFDPLRGEARFQSVLDRLHLK